MSLWSGRWLSLSGSLLIWIETSVSMNHNNTLPLPGLTAQLLHNHIPSCVLCALCNQKFNERKSYKLIWGKLHAAYLHRNVLTNLFLSQSHSSFIQCLEHFLNFPLCSSPLKNHDFDCILGMEASKKSRWSFWRYYISSERRPRYRWWARMTIRNLNRSFWERSNGGNVHCESWRWSVRPDQSWHN